MEKPHSTLVTLLEDLFFQHSTPSICPVKVIVTIGNIWCSEAEKEKIKENLQKEK
jgi:hypothetical protein